jgi:hypothetical protein
MEPEMLRGYDQVKNIQVFNRRWLSHLSTFGNFFAAILVASIYFQHIYSILFFPYSHQNLLLKTILGVI